ncbi:hypothetical protein SHI21_09545 [Bacteriovorax sp. PP10]|uniref:Uncharacterized protein n=1 Tax=Bacteriovorax antarcticus TaxID=3088717 RepID=A0ABU5VV03_9BACT|nr:hypothetical protein [Bacteriovorax sp. PP10]MEA9356447.1 hypothetical protein [Bacteriovorax sp. PP10]
MHLIVLSFMLSITSSFAALEYSKVEYPGCPENAYCQKNTGEVRRQWLDSLDEFNRSKISESKFNADLQKNNGVPVAGWAMEEAGVLPRIMMWDSPCKQHKQEASKFYISELFRKNLRSSELKEYTNIYFPRVVLVDNNKKVFSMVVPRGDIPTFMDNGSLHYLKEDDGKYYGFLINRDGDIRITKPQIVKELPKEVVCLKEQVDLFMREAPSPTFYQSYHCMDIWDKNSKTYKPILFGRSCN